MTNQIISKTKHAESSHWIDCDDPFDNFLTVIDIRDNSADI